MTSRLSVGQCKKGLDVKDLSDCQLTAIRDLLYEIADVVTDAYIDWEKLDEHAFSPPGKGLDRIIREKLAKILGE